jgi:hypothetical protein
MGVPAKVISDDDRRAKATRDPAGRWMVGPWETDRCRHGRLYSFRWRWPIGCDVEDGTPEIGKSNCKKCEADE